MSEDGSNHRERVMANSPSYNLAKHQGRWPRDSPGSTSRWVSLKPTSDTRGPAEVLGSRPVPTPASRTNRVYLLLIQNTLIPMSWGRVGINLCSHLHQFQQTPRYSSTLTRWGHSSQVSCSRSQTGSPSLTMWHQRLKRWPRRSLRTSRAEFLETLKPLKASVDINHYEEDQPLLPQSPRGSTYCQESLNRHLVPLKPQLAAVMSTTHPAPLALETLHQF